MIFNFQNAIKYYIQNPQGGLVEMSGEPKTSQKQQIAGYQAQGDFDQEEIDRIKDTIKYMETRNQQNPYVFVGPTTIKEYGNDLGAYQISEAKLRENAKRFLGRNVTREEFLQSPALQDKFVESEIKFLLDNNFKVNSLFAAHRGGWSDMSRTATIKRNQKRAGYIDAAMKQYQELSKKKTEKKTDVIDMPDEKPEIPKNKLQRNEQAMDQDPIHNFLADIRDKLGDDEIELEIS